MQFIAEVVGLSGNIASLLSFPLVAIPVAIFLALKQRGPAVKSWQRNSLAVLFTLGICAYSMDVADRFGLMAPIIAKLPLEEVYDKTFVNERVPLDGYSYNHCTFMNVSFVINGRRSGAINNSVLRGYAITSDNPDVTTAISALNILGMLKVPYLENGHVIQPYGNNPTFVPAIPPAPPTPSETKTK